MSKLLLIALFFSSVSLSAQKEGHSKIIITVADTANLLQKVKYALVNEDFMIKDNGKTDSLTTYVREYSGIYCSALATINSNKVTLQGWYGLKRIDHFGYTQSPRGYKPVIYFANGNGKGWKLLAKVAKQLNGELTYQD